MESMRGKKRYFDLLFWGCFKGFYVQTLYGEFFSLKLGCRHCHTASLKEMKSQLTQKRERDMVPSKLMGKVIDTHTNSSATI